MGTPLQRSESCGRSVAIGLALLWHAAAPAAEGLAVAATDAPWPRWQLRLSVQDNPPSRWIPGEGLDLSPPLRAALLGDYDLGTFGLAMPGLTGRFRATSGLLLGLRGAGAGAGMGSTWAAIVTDGATPAAPYLGLGYTGWLAKTGLSFSADLGLTAEYPGGSWRTGRALFGNQGADAAFRELRLQPRLQLGMQYKY